MKRSIVALAAVCVTHCASAAPPIAHASASPAPASPAPDVAALDAVRAHIAAGEADALALVAMRLGAAGSARDLNGDRATDDRIARADLLGRVDDAGAILVLTTCGNATLGTVRWSGTSWVAAEHVDLVDEMRPAQCGATEVHGEALALSSDTRRELAIVWRTEDAIGDTIRGPFLSVYRLEPRGVLTVLLHDAPFGATDDASGATTVGNYAVIEDIPPPRDLHVSIAPGHRGPGGVPDPVIVRRRYALRGAQLVMVQESTEPAE